MALSADRETPARFCDVYSGPAAAGVRIFGGAIVMRDATGHLTKGAAATGAIGVGRAEWEVDNRSGADGALGVPYRPGVFIFDNASSADEITIAEIGALCWVVDDETVAKTDGTGSRSPAGVVVAVDDLGVWVRFDEGLTAAFAAAAA